jgi:hypothetical protein
MSDTIVANLTLDSLRSALQLAGYRAETVADPVGDFTYLRSATNGMTFDIRPGTQFADGSFLDAAFVGVLQVQGELPLDIVNRWNSSRRFARLHLSHPFLMLVLDVTVAGGVSQNYLRAQIEIWDQLLQQLIVYLRDELPKIGATNGAAAGSVSSAVNSETGRSNQSIASATVQ